MYLFHFCSHHQKVKAIIWLVGLGHEFIFKHKMTPMMTEPKIDHRYSDNNSALNWTFCATLEFERWFIDSFSEKLDAPAAVNFSLEIREHLYKRLLSSNKSSFTSILSPFVPSHLGQTPPHTVSLGLNDLFCKTDRVFFVVSASERA